MTQDTPIFSQLPSGVIVAHEHDVGSIKFEHFHSQFEKFPLTNTDDVNNETSTGTTDWVSASKPTISVGWDWKLDRYEQSWKMERITDYRTNLKILGENEQELDRVAFETTLTIVFRHLQWQSSVISALKL